MIRPFKAKTLGHLLGECTGPRRKQTRYIKIKRGARYNPLGFGKKIRPLLFPFRGEKNSEKKASSLKN